MESVGEVLRKIKEPNEFWIHKNSDDELLVLSFAIEFATICKNIKETSFNESDRIERCKKLSIDSGIDLYHIKKLTL